MRLYIRSFEHNSPSFSIGATDKTWEEIVFQTQTYYWLIKTQIGIHV